MGSLLRSEKLTEDCVTAPVSRPSKLAVGFEFLTMAAQGHTQKLFPSFLFYEDFSNSYVDCRFEILSQKFSMKIETKRNL